MSFITKQDGYSALTAAGYALTIVILIAVFLIGLIIAGHRKKMTAKTLSFSAVAIAIAFVLSYVKLFSMPWGGSVTLCSMLFVVLVGYWYGPGVGFIAAFAFSLLEFVQDGGAYILSPLQACMDYFFAFTALGASGFFAKKKHGLLIGYIVAVILRGFFHSIGGAMFWMSDMPASFPKSISFLWPIVYNYGYLLPEMIITIIIISLPPVKKALNNVTRIARGETN